MKPFTLLALAIFSFAYAIAQPIYKPGFIIRANGDKEQVEIDFQDWNRNPVAIKTKSASGTIETLPLHDLQAFEVTGFVRYEKAVVSINNRPVYAIHRSIDFEEKNIVDTVFLKVIVSGTPLTIYQYIDFKPHFYYKTAGGKIEELFYAEDDESFRQQLKDAIPFELNPAQQKQLDKLNYNSRSFLAFAKMVNTNSAYENKPTQKIDRFDFTIGAGVALQRINLSSRYEHFDKLEFTSFVSPLYSAGVDYWIGNFRKRLAIRTDVSYYQLKTQGNFTTPAGMNTYHQYYEYTIEQKNIATSLGFIYNFIESQQVKVYAGASMSVTFSKYPKNRYITRFVDYNTQYWVGPLYMRPTWSSGRLQAGMIVKDRIELNLYSALGGGYINGKATSDKGSKIFMRLGIRL